MTSPVISEDQIFNIARRIDCPELRRVFLEEVCGPGGELARRVSELLQADVEDDFLELGPAPVNTVTQASGFRDNPHPSTELPEESIGSYKLLEVIGEGGMGTVYMAEQTEPVKRRVALKLIKTGMDTQQVITRFEAERQALALMDHQNIAKVYDAGATDSGRPYFVMELVKGKPITKFCDEQRLDTEARLKLFQKVCQAVQHAHQKGIIHRDLKPSNVMVAMYDDQPVPKVIDFGVAKATGDELTEQTMFTRFGQIVGTLEYMSPEQAQFNNLDIDTRSDIYSMGAILYELLAGEPPFECEKIKSQALDETLRMIREDEPTKPSTRLSAIRDATQAASNQQTSPAKLGSILRGDLDWIVMKTLEKDRVRRYDTCSSLSEDIERHFRTEPISAGPPSATYRFGKFLKRHRVQFAVMTLVIAIVAVGTFFSAWYAVRAKIAEADAKQQARQASLSEAHAIVREQEAIREASISEAVSEFLNVDLLGNADPDAQPDRDLKVREVMDRASTQIEHRFGSQPLVKAAIRRLIGEAYRSLGDSDKAEEHLQKSLEIYRQHIGHDSEKSVETELSLLLVMHDEGHYESVRRKLEDIVVTCSSKFGVASPLTLKSKWQLAEILVHLENPDAALKICENILANCDQTLDADHQLTLRTIAVSASAYGGLGQYDKAEQLYLDARDQFAEILGENHPATIKLLKGYGIRCAMQHRHSEAESIFRRTLSMEQSSLGLNHPETLVTKSHIANSIFLQGRKEDGLEMAQSIYQEHLRILGEDDWRSISCRFKNAVLINELKGPEAAFSELSELVSGARRALSPANPTRRQILNWYGIVLEELDRHDEQIKLHEQELDLQLKALGPSHVATDESVSKLSKLYAKHHKPKLRIQLLQQQIQRLKACYEIDESLPQARLIAGYLKELALLFAMSDELLQARETWIAESNFRALVATKAPNDLFNLTAWAGCECNQAMVALDLTSADDHSETLIECLPLLDSAEHRLNAILGVQPQNPMAKAFLKNTLQTSAKVAARLNRHKLAASSLGKLEVLDPAAKVNYRQQKLDSLLSAGEYEAVVKELEKSTIQETLESNDLLEIVRGFSRCLGSVRADETLVKKSQDELVTEICDKTSAVLQQILDQEEKLKRQQLSFLLKNVDFDPVRDLPQFESLSQLLEDENGK